MEINKPVMGFYEEEFATLGEIFVPLTASATYLSWYAMEYLLSLPFLPGRAFWDATIIGVCYRPVSSLGYEAGREVGHLVDMAADIDFKKVFATHRKGETHGRESSLRAYPR